MRSEATTCLRAEVTGMPLDIMVPIAGLPDNPFLSVLMAFVALGAYLKRRAFVEWQLRHWSDESDTFSWNLAHYISSPPLLMRGYDVTDSFAPLVPHRRYHQSLNTLDAVPSDALLPRELLDRLEGRPPLRGSPKGTPAAHDTVVKVFADRGDWVTALAATAYVERRRQCISADDANTSILCLLDARKRFQALKLVTTKYANVPLPESTIARLLREFSDDSVVLSQLIERCHAHSGSLTAELASSAMTSVSSCDWVAGLVLFRQLVPPPREAPPLGALQGLAVNLNKACVADTVLEGFLDVAARRWPAEYPSALLSIIETRVARRRVEQELLRLAPPQSAGVACDSSTVTASWVLAVAFANQQRNVASSVATVNHIVRYAPHRVVAAESVMASLASSAELDAALKAIARPVASNGNWRLAVDLARLAMRRRACDAVPALTHTVATKGHWSVALKLCTQAFTVRRAPPSAAEMSLCVHSSVMCGRWAAALFWIERAHARGMRFAPSVYDAAFSVTANNKWQASLRAYMGMAEVGGTCTEQGVTAFVTGAASQSRGHSALEVIAMADNVTWER